MTSFSQGKVELGKMQGMGIGNLGEHIGNLKGNTVGTYWEPGKNDPFFLRPPHYMDDLRCIHTWC